jgi:hypothetical protein
MELYGSCTTQMMVRGWGKKSLDGLEKGCVVRLFRVKKMLVVI